jgi:hypothetical protein
LATWCPANEVEVVAVEERLGNLLPEGPLAGTAPAASPSVLRRVGVAPEEIGEHLAGRDGEGLRNAAYLLDTAELRAEPAVDAENAIGGDGGDRHLHEDAVEVSHSSPFWSRRAHLSKKP